MHLEWNPAKADANRRVHGVSFAEAVTVLEDEFALTYREPDVIRVISAWKANRRQEEQYGKGRG